MLSQLVNRAEPLGPEAKVLVLGGGFSGSCVARMMQALGTPVLSTRRCPEPGSKDLGFDSATGLEPTARDLAGVSHVLSTIPPTRAGVDPALDRLGPLLNSLSPTWVGYLSTTGVYGDRQGQWVSESDAACPSQDRSRRRLDCEQAWLSSGLPVQILRLPGIYGPGRSVLEGLISKRVRRINKPDQVFCRIHVEDIAGACLHLMHKAAAGIAPPIVNVVDDEPAPSAELLEFGAELLGCDPPVEESYADASQNMSTMAQSFWSENRRVSNRLLCEQLGYTLLHPNYRDGLRDCLKQSRQSDADSPMIN